MRGSSGICAILRDASRPTVQGTRKIAAILVADIVGYSRLTGTDEDRTLSGLRGLRSDLIDPAIDAHHGRIVKALPSLARDLSEGTLSHQPFLLFTTWPVVRPGIHKFNGLASRQDAARDPFLARCDNATTTPHRRH